MGIPKGTTLTENPKDKVLRVRIDEQTGRQLAAVCDHKKESKSEVVRRGIEMQYNELEQSTDKRK